MPGHIKPPSKRINRITKNVGVISAAGKAPPMPSGLCQQAQDAWRAFWTDHVSGIMRPPDSTVAIRWARNTDRYLRLIAEADREPLVTGSQGQDRPNPLYDLAFKVEASIKADEAQLGIGALNRLRLGAQLSEAAKTLADLNAEETNVTDPRAALTLLADRRAATAELPTTD
jgi:hypothetical protein